MIGYEFLAEVGFFFSSPCLDRFCVILELYPNCIRSQRRECLEDLETLVTVTRYSYSGEVLEDLLSIPGSSRYYFFPPFDLLRNPPGLLSSVLLRYSGSSVEVTNHVYEAGCLGRSFFFYFAPIPSAVVFRLRGIFIFIYYRPFSTSSQSNCPYQ